MKSCLQQVVKVIQERKPDKNSDHKYNDYSSNGLVVPIVVRSVNQRPRRPIEVLH